MKDSVLPEEKLLRLIKGSKKSANIEVPIAKVVPVVTDNIKLVSVRFPKFKLNKVLITIFIVSLIYLATSIVHPMVFSKKIKIPVINHKAEKGNAAKTIQAKSSIKPYSFYLDGIKQRKIFASAALDLEKPTGTASADLIKDVNLVGIISGDEPQAIIEDKKAQKTYYLRKGQFIGKLQLENITEGKIILSYEGQRYELYL